MKHSNYSTKEQKQLGEAVRKTQYAPARVDDHGAIELVFNPQTGCFEEAPAGSATNGEIVTEMTKDGFAVEENVETKVAWSRNHGLLETEVLLGKHVCVVGLGSFGSSVALELAKAGVGEFSIVDPDRLERHNLVRHIGYLKDIGRLKTDVVEEAILGKNPDAIVHSYPVEVADAGLDSIVAGCDLVICCTDNNPSRFLIESVCHTHGKTAIYGRAYVRAEGGDVFVSRCYDACYSCLVGGVGAVNEEISDELQARRDGRIPAYMSSEEASAVVQVGLSVDIAPICNMIERIALMELSRGVESGISSLEEELSDNYFIWANRRDRKFANWSAFPSAGPCICRWYAAHFNKRINCAVCGTGSFIDEESD